MQNAVIYIRVSSERQKGTGLGREAQESACRAYCETRGINILAVKVDDGLSGTLPLAKRPRLAEAVDVLQANPGAIFLVHSLSRFARSQKELWTLLSGDDPVPLVSATEPFDISTAMGKAFVGMLGVIAALESDLASERTLAAIGAKRARGESWGQKPMSQLGVDVARIQELYATGNFTHASLADHLNAMGVPSAKGKKWHAKTVRSALLST